ncbi:hypothetical protein CAOG_01447 [Capsaspora owczarzaki ATCC 30864]|uniref:Ribosomal protein L19 n=1 Tax=Capsaspora owczarzaki (strain ATCC 30864) TaxID=595528 RepID=A0A0D2VJD3_CAPO3|nr:hypothetical protein CAOG_01447 [Capsaspora owczarzaki ATCC 30864]KJE90072.1 hypothetical protein CAOG_001447 [Capsaspora owczarzaki ATCC 30864]|eukprot:XP_004364315.1 hypothetical protein CAOG_01447 [Capsaspora owczarzaki ATCC 30864]
MQSAAVVAVARRGIATASSAALAGAAAAKPPPPQAKRTAPAGGAAAAAAPAKEAAPTKDAARQALRTFLAEEPFETSKTDMLSWLKRREVRLQRYNAAPVPAFDVGSIISVKYRTSMTGEDANRVTKYMGIVVKKRWNLGLSSWFTIRNVIEDEVVEFTFPTHSPRVMDITVLRPGRADRNALSKMLDRLPKKHSTFTLEGMGGRTEKQVIEVTRRAAQAKTEAAVSAEFLRARGQSLALSTVAKMRELAEKDGRQVSVDEAALAAQRAYDLATKRNKSTTVVPPASAHASRKPSGLPGISAPTATAVASLASVDINAAENMLRRENIAALYGVETLEGVDKAVQATSSGKR